MTYKSVDKFIVAYKSVDMDAGMIDQHECGWQSGSLTEPENWFQVSSFIPMSEIITWLLLRWVKYHLTICIHTEKELACATPRQIFLRIIGKLLYDVL